MISSKWYFREINKLWIKPSDSFLNPSDLFVGVCLQSGDRIDYRNMTLISRFLSEQGKILSRRVNRLTLKEQRLITIAIKQARILSLLPFLNNEKQFERSGLTARPPGLRTRKK